jgi:hypothetical protein
MDWNAAIEKNREALKRVLAMLVAMAGLGQSAIGSRQSGSAQAADGLTDCPLPTADCRPTLPRHLRLAVLRLLRPAEAAARRLIIAAARGMVVTVPPERPRGPGPKHSTNDGARGDRPPLRFASQTTSPPLDGGEETPAATPGALPLPRRAGERCRAKRGGVGVDLPVFNRTSAPRLAFPLFDPLRRFGRHRPARSGVPRISVPGFSEPFRIPPPPSPDDAVDTTRLAMRLAVLARVLDDLPREARRFARWRARRDSRAGSPSSEGRTRQAAHPGKTRSGGDCRVRRIWPLRPGRPPGSRPAHGGRPWHEVYDILDVTHGLAFWALEDTS